MIEARITDLVHRSKKVYARNHMRSYVMLKLRNVCNVSELMGGGGGCYGGETGGYVSLATFEKLYSHKLAVKSV